MYQFIKKYRVNEENQNIELIDIGEIKLSEIGIIWPNMDYFIDVQYKQFDNENYVRENTIKELKYLYWFSTERDTENYYFCLYYETIEHLLEDYNPIKIILVTL